MRSIFFIKTFFIFLFLLAIIELKAEGTKQIMPTASSNGQVQLRSSTSLFALTTGSVNDRLHIHIKTVGEKICFGFGNTLNDNGSTNSGTTFQIKNPAGTIVMGPTAIPTSGAGYISTYTQAIIGPTNLSGNSGGYTPLTYTSLVTGDYYIEFSYPGTLDRVRFEFFDIQVGSVSNNEIDGRVWSKSWQFTSGSQNAMADGSLHVYADDGIVTKIYLNNIQPYVFVINCNPFGIYNTGNFTNDRKSVAVQVLAPQYKIFFTDPDPTVYPTGSFGSITGPVTTNSQCDGNLQIFVPVNKAGKVDIFFDINPLPGAQAEDLSLNANVNVGSNTIVWNGLNGLSNPIPSGSVFNITVTYINGLTNLPIWDPDTHLYGYIVDLIRPSGPKPPIFWDDTQVGGSSNLTGCTTPSGCHPFAYSVGNNKTINTWWYASSVTGSPVIVNYRRSYSGTATQSICEGDSLLFSGTWVSAAGTYTNTTLNQQGCDSTSIVTLSLKPRPTVNLGPDTTACDGNPVTFNAGSGLGYTYAWSNGATTQQVTVTNSGTYSVIVTNSQGCKRTDSVEFISLPMPGILPIKHN